MGGIDVRDKFPNDVHLRRAYLPIYPAQNQDTETRLHLKNGAELDKESYANTRKKHAVPFNILRLCYDRDHVPTQYVLTSDSYRKLARHVEFVLPITPNRTLPITRTRDERLGLTPVTYGTIPMPRAPATAPGQDTLTRPLIQGYYNTAWATRQHNRAQSREQDELLPHYHSRSPARYSSASGAAEGDGTRALAKLVFRSVLAGITVWGLLSAWAHRVEIGDGLLGGVGWVVAHALRSMKGAVGELLRAVVWVVAQIAEMGKIGALKVWEWLRATLGLMFNGRHGE